ncbi:MAG: FecR family protein [Mangrovibacterium sp.]
MSEKKEIIQQYFKHSQPTKVMKNFSLWIKNNAGNADKEAALFDIWNELDITDDESTAKSLQAVRQKIAAAPQRKKQSLLMPLWRAAIILILPLLSIGITYSIMNAEPAAEEIKLIECMVPDGETRSITLPDSSQVTINSGSILIYPERFGTSRNIYLNGEAYFKVKRDESKPFVVKTSDMDVEVLGTVFNISAYSDESKISTTLESGKVSLRLKNISNNAIILQPDEQLSYNRRLGSISKNRVNVSNSTAWVDGRLIIQSMPLDEVIPLIERKYALKVYVSSNDFMNERITMKMSPDKDIYEFMSVLQYIVPQMKYKIENNNLYIH